MFYVEMYFRVRRACLVEGMSVREASRVFDLHRDTVRKMLDNATPQGYTRQSPPRKPKLEPYTGVIDAILEADGRVPRKQRHTDRRQLVLPVTSTIFAGRYGVIIRYGGTVDYRPTSQAIEAETYGRQDTGNGSGQGWDERAFSAQVAERPIAVAGETGASVAHSAGSLRRGVGG